MPMFCQGSQCDAGTGECIPTFAENPDIQDADLPLVRTRSPVSRENIDLKHIATEKASEFPP